MNSPDTLTSLLDNLQTEQGTAKGETVAQLRKAAQELGDELQTLRRRVATLEEENRKLAAESRSRSAGEEFVEEAGVLFKRKPGGGYHKVPYCPRCHAPLGSMPGMPYFCSAQCGFVSAITESNLREIMGDLPR